MGKYAFMQRNGIAWFAEQEPDYDFFVIKIFSYILYFLLNDQKKGNSWKHLAESREGKF